MGMNREEVTAGARPRRRQGVRLLLIEPNAFVRDSLAVLFERAGYTADTAEDAPAALEIAAGNEWDCVVTELDLPGVGGLELYARLLFQSRPRLPAVFLSIRPPAALRLGLGGAPWVALLQKPCTFPTLLAAVERSLAAPRAR
jgi:CheY-like chemotaxis protein